MTTTRLLIVLAVASPCLAEENIRRVATWNMKWLGGSVGTPDDTSNLNRYADHIGASGQDSSPCRGSRRHTRTTGRSGATTST